MSHIQHPRIVDHGLVDGCDRCAQIAVDPFVHLDDDNLRALVRRTRLWMRDQGDCYPRSTTERNAMAVMETTLCRVACLRQIGALDSGGVAYEQGSSLRDDYPSGSRDGEPTDTPIYGAGSGL